VFVGLANIDEDGAAAVKRLAGDIQRDRISGSSTVSAGRQTEDTTPDQGQDRSAAMGWDWGWMGSQRHRSCGLYQQRRIFDQ
jgi:hypothetical protein